MKKLKVNEEELDFLNEIINIGAGNAAVALGQVLSTGIDIDLPRVEVVSHSQLSEAIGFPDNTVVGVKMGIVGDITGHLFFLVPEEYKTDLIDFAHHTPEFSGIEDIKDISIFEEIGNIMAGVYFTAIHDFCGLNLYHTVPRAAEDMLLALLDESIAVKMRAASRFILIESMFKIDSQVNKKIRVFFVIILTKDSINTFLKSIKKTREKMYSG